MTGTEIVLSAQAIKWIGILIAAIILYAMKDYIGNWIGGFTFFMSSYFKPGDIVYVDGERGHHKLGRNSKNRVHLFRRKSKRREVMAGSGQREDKISEIREASERVSHWIVVVTILALMLTGYLGYKKIVRDTKKIENLIITQKFFYEGELQAQRDEFLHDQTTAIPKTFMESRTLIKEYIHFINPSLTEDKIFLIIDSINAECAKYENLDPSFVLFTMQIESSFNQLAVSKMNAKGLMQIFPEVWFNLDLPENLTTIGIESEKELFAIETNIKAGAHILNVYQNECKASRKFNNKYEITECASKKYFGGNHKWYFDRLRKAAGHFWFWLLNRESISKHPGKFFFKFEEASGLRVIRPQNGFTEMKELKNVRRDTV